MKKRLRIITLVLALLVCLAACADAGTGEQTGNGQTEKAETGAAQTGEQTGNGQTDDTDSGTEPAGEQTGNDLTETEQTVEETEPAAPRGEAVLVEFSAFDLDGNAVDQSVFRGKKLNVVNVWATFCGPCIREMPELGSVSRAFADRGVSIVGVVVDVVDENYRKMDAYLNEARDIVSQTGASYLHIVPSAQMSKVCRVQYVPTTFFLDGEGYQVAEPVIGSRTEAQWTELIESLLKTLG